MEDTNYNNTDMENISYGIENVDYVMINGTPETPRGMAGKLKHYRSRYFDRDLVAYPIIKESERVLHPENLTEEEKLRLDTARYELSGGVYQDSRFHTEFDYYAALIRACEDNGDAVAQLKRRVTAYYYIVHSLYTRVYDACLINNAKDMGSNNTTRNAWFHMHYNALYEIDMMLDNFLDEVDIELERWQSFAKAASRSLASLELSYASSGKLYTNKSGKYLV